MIFEIFEISALLEGDILAHSIKHNGISFKKGRILSTDDIQSCYGADIQSLNIVRLQVGDIHENDAAEKLSTAFRDPSITFTAPFTGRVNLVAKNAGVLSIDQEKLIKFNLIDESITIATLPNYSVVKPKQLIATIKIIPFSVPQSLLLDALSLWDTSPITLSKFSGKKISLIQTELPSVKISTLDKTTRTLGQRLESLDSYIVEEQRCDHAVSTLSKALQNIATGTNIIIITGASAITDRRDILPAALENAGGKILQLGMPVDPGNLLMLGDLKGIPVLGMPGCARSSKLNGFDWVLQRLCADISITKTDLAEMSIGGLLKEIPNRPSPRVEVKAQENIRYLPKVGIILLAAGQSRRMGETNKLLATYHDVPLLQHTLNCLGQIAAHEFLVVTGRKDKEISKLIHKTDAQEIANPEYADGLSTSLKAGISGLSDSCEAALICLVDMPLLTPSDVQAITAAYSVEDHREICIPTFKNKRGNPVLLGRRFFSEVFELTGDIGAKPIISAYPDHIIEVPMKNDAVLVDTDTLEALKSLEKRL